MWWLLQEKKTIRKKKREKELASPTVASRRVRGIAGEEVASASA